jgi:tRNA threonylcarbamoyladenosine biosynthesis protein TsaE
MRTVSTITKSPEQTGQLAAAVAPLLKKGDVLILTGGLAAGKTYFVQQLVRALGSADEPTSPTFAIANFYETQAAPFIHVDAYRLSGPKEYEDLGLDEFAEASIMAIEWGERVQDAFDEYLTIQFELEASEENLRRIVLTPTGSRWVSSAGTLRSVVETC